MKRSINFLVLLLSIFVTGFAQAQNVNTQGRDFWVSFLPQWPDDSVIPKLELLVAGQRPCSGRASNPLTGWSTTFSVTPGTVTSIIIPNSEGLMEKENRVEHKAIHVTTTDDVSLYASNFEDWSFDIANVLPSDILTGNYIAQSYDIGALAKNSFQDIKSKMVIIATEDNTVISIDPKGGLRDRLPSYSKREITLNKGECYLCISAKGDISGTAVNVKNGKKVAVFSGCDTQIPYDKCCYDAVFEQCMPLAYWGKHFVVTASAERTRDVVRITSLAPGCRISIDGRYRKTLGARQFYEFNLDGTQKEAVYVSASSPVSVCLYLTSGQYGGEMGDPSMVYINPIEQQMDKVTFGSYNTAKTKYHFVNIVTQTSQVQGMTMDGRSIGTEFRPVPHKNELSYARVRIAHGSHTLESARGGFVAHIYGLGEWESYAYTVGSSTKVLNQFDDEGHLVLSTIPDELDVGKDTSENNVFPDEDIPTDADADTLSAVESGGVAIQDEHDEIVDTPELTDLTDETPPTYVLNDTLAAVVFDGITLSQLRQGSEVRGRIEDTKGLIVDPEVFDITAKSDYDYLFDKIDVNFEGDTVILGFHPRGEWCDCFTPRQLKVDVLLVPRTEGGGKSGRISIPVTVPVIKDQSWVSRCLWVLLSIGALLLFIVYLLSLLRKKRFKKNAMIVPTYFNHRGNRIEQGGTPLRKSGFGAWFARWFLPGNERNTLTFTAPAVSVRFVATNSSDVVCIPKESVDPSTMKITGFNPHGNSSAQLGNNARIQISQPNGTNAGYLTFMPGSRNDGGFYRLLLLILVAAAVFSIVAFVVLMIKGVL